VATGVDHGRGRPRASGAGQGRSYPGGPRQKGAASSQWWALAAGEEGGTEGGLAPAADFDSGVQQEAALPQRRAQVAEWQRISMFWIAVGTGHWVYLMNRFVSCSS
jgi:hypothetical protein